MAGGLRRNTHRSPAMKKLLRKLGLIPADTAFNRSADEYARTTRALTAVQRRREAENKCRENKDDPKAST